MSTAIERSTPGKRDDMLPNPSQNRPILAPYVPDVFLVAQRDKKQSGCLNMKPAQTVPATMRVLAIDPSLRGTGYAILEKNGGKLRAIEYGVIRNGDKLLPSSCLVAIHDRVAELIRQHEPECAAVEGVIYVQSHRIAITLGAARGAAILALAERGLPVYEYAPRRVKQAVVGRGAAAKTQVAFMVRARLGLTESPQADAADALAIGLTHFQAHETASHGAAVLVRV